jgi:hypothetical protein
MATKPSAENAGVTWFELNPWKARLILVVMTLLFLEAVVRVLVYANLLPYENHPTAAFKTYIDTIDRNVGRWGYPNASLSLTESCTTVDYETNSYGARDSERTKIGKNRVVLLGDSFAAGHWMKVESRFSNILEHRTGLEHMNFALPGSGTIHQWQVYEHKAAAFEHDAVMLFVLPFNDFTDNRPDNSYQPYLREKDGELELFYSIKFEDVKFDELSLGGRIKNTIDNTSYLANILRSGARILKAWRRGEGYARNRRDEGIASINAGASSDYDSYTPTDMRFFKAAISGIAQRAGDRPFYVFLIPFFKDFEAAQVNGYDFALLDEMQSLVSDHPNLRVVDLLPAFLENALENDYSYDDYVLGCDSHWNEMGHELAADAVYKALFEDLYQTEY